MKEKLWTKDFIIACITNFLFACAFNLLMPTIPIYLSEELHIEQSKVGIALSSYVLSLLIFRPFCGYIVDVYARKPLYLLGITFFIAIFFGYFFATTLLFFVILRFFHGFFWGLSTVSANTVAIDIIPSSRRAEGIGFFGVNNNIAMAVAPFIAVNIYEQQGFHFLIWCAIGMGVLAITALTFLKVPRRAKLDQVPPISLDRFILIKGLPLFFNQLFISYGWGTLVAFAVLYGKQTGVHNSGIFFLFLAGGIVASRVVAGKLVDQGHVHKVMAFALLLVSISFIAFSQLHSIYAFCISAFFVGIGFGSLFPSLQTLYINMAPSSKRGTANSTYLTGFDLGVGIGMLVGAVISGKWNFSTMYLITAISVFVALIIYWFYSRKIYERNKIVAVN